MQTNDSTPPAGPSPLSTQLLNSLEKTLRSYRLYEARGPQYEAHMGGLSKSASEATAQGPVTINLSPFGPYMDGESAPTKGDYARQWFDLFEEGARQIVISTGITDEEIRELMHVLCGTDVDSEDIVTALWRKNLHHISVQVARVLIRHSDMLGTDKKHTLEQELGRWRRMLGGVSNDGGVEFAEQERHMELQQDDFRLLALDEKNFDWCRIAREAPAEVRADARRPRLSDDIDRQITDYERFLDVVDASGSDAKKLLLDVLGALIHYGDAPELDRFLLILASHDGVGSKAVYALMDDTEVLAQLVPMIEAAPDVFTGSIEAFAALNVPLLPEQEHEEDILSEAPTEMFAVPEQPESVDQIEVHRSNIFSQNPRTACESVNALFAMSTESSIEIAVQAYASKSVSVRQLVVIHVLRRTMGENPDSLRVKLEALAIDGLKDADAGIRKLVQQHFLKHLSEDRLNAVMKSMTNSGFSGKDLSERVLMLQIVSRYDHEQKIIDFLCALLLKYRLFSSDQELQFQAEVAKKLLRSDNPKAQNAIQKVLKRWTVTTQVKTMIREEIKALEKESEVDG